MRAVYGAGAHGQDIAHDLGPNFAGFADDNIDYPPVDCPPHLWIVGVNDGQTRQIIAEREGFTLGMWVHSRALVGPDVAFGVHTHVNAGAFLTRCQLGDYCTVGPNATICGDVTIGHRVTIGAGATIRNLVTVCDDVTIGAGATVVRSILEPGVYVGTPARRLR